MSVSERARTESQMICRNLPSAQPGPDTGVLK